MRNLNSNLTFSLRNIYISDQYDPIINVNYCPPPHTHVQWGTKSKNVYFFRKNIKMPDLNNKQADSGGWNEEDDGGANKSLVWTPPPSSAHPSSSHLTLS